MQELPIPTDVQRAPDAFELVRVWAALGAQHVSLRANTWDDPAAWGIMLADLAQHAAKSYAAEANRDVDAVLRRIVEGFTAEIGSPTDPDSVVSR